MKISEALGVSSAALWNCGVFDSYLGIDSRLHIDPALLRRTRLPEFVHSWKNFEKYFAGVFVFLSSATSGGSLERQGINKLVFPEVNLAALGYSDGKTQGRGVSHRLAKQLYFTAQEIVKIGIKDPSIFELAIVFEEGFGPDLISDMTLWIILDDVGAFNAKVCKKLKIPTCEAQIGNRTVTASVSKVGQNPILLLPRSLLADLPEATCYEDISSVAAYNREVRENLSRVLGIGWRRLVKDYSKREMKKLLLSDPDLLKALLKAYKSGQAEPYDFVADPLGEIVWEIIAKKEAKAHALSLTAVASRDDLARTVLQLTAQFKHLVEQCGLYAHLYASGKHRPEKFAQLLYYGIADAYCKANNLDLNAEPNAGRGPVDFKMSRGYQGRAVVELKLSSNSKALDGLLAQLPTYAKAENAIYSCFVLVVIGSNKRKVDRIVAERNRLLQARKSVPNLVVVNAFAARHAPSASRLRWSD